MTIAKELDARGLNCPLPTLHAKKAITGASSEVLKIVATDPGSVRDIEAFCRQTGNALLRSSQEGSSYTFHVRKV